MIDQKRENLLNLALAATEVERRRVPELSAGYNSYSKTWEVIVQYQGDLAFLEEQGVRVTLLLFSYAILLVPESLMDYVTGLPQITYLEKPKLLYFADAFVRSISCITPGCRGMACHKTGEVLSDQASDAPCRGQERACRSGCRRGKSVRSRFHPHKPSRSGD
jgi:minor extracellular serine protease Vpr